MAHGIQVGSIGGREKGRRNRDHQKRGIRERSGHRGETQGDWFQNKREEGISHKAAQRSIAKRAGIVQASRRTIRESRGDYQDENPRLQPKGK